jgi:hypothetical protein
MASTYVNDLRLNEMATGDGSGTWGTTTNTNLELIAEAFSYGTEAITTNADTHATVIADGATDPGRSMYLKYTGTLDSACTITISPNTVSKLWFIENGTTGSQNIILSCGSGANITIPAGDTKVVYSDGAGAGAAFVDAFASINVGALTGTSLDISGDIDVDGTTNLDVVDIDGAVDMASTALVTGVLTTTAATVFNGGFASNDTSTIIAVDGAADNAYALQIKNQEATDDRSYGVLIQAGSTFTDAPLNITTHDGGTSLFTLVGSGQARFVNGTAAAPSVSFLTDLDTGFYRVGTNSIGFSTAGVARFVIASDGSLSTPTLGTSNVRFGGNAGNSITSGGNYNVVVGDEAGTAITTGDANVLVLQEITTQQWDIIVLALIYFQTTT